jgi:RNA-directed DNA polymerase
MNAMEKSDLPEVARKRANKAASAAAEPVERRGGAKENADLQSAVRTQSREAVSQAQARIREAVTRNRQDKLTALLHHINIDVLRTSFFGLKKTAAPGVDEMTWIEYAEHLEANLLDLHARVHTGAYRALPSLRKYIPKADGRQRPLGIAAMEDKIVQAAVVAILTPIYESEFLGFSYGFRPKRNQHQALDALAFGIGKRRPWFPLREERLVTLAGAHRCSAVSKQGETDKHLYLQSKSVAVSPFHGFRRTVGVI